MNRKTSQGEPQVTIVVVPRERFSYTCESLESIYQHTDIPFKLIYVDGGSPRKTQRYLEAQAREKGFHLIRTDYYLSPNRARNLGLRQVHTKYVVFIDNDVMVAPNWLSPLVQCAEETGAAIVGPLNCHGYPLHEIVHFAGGECAVRLETEGDKVKRHLVDKIYKQGRRVADIRDQLKRHQTTVAEFHCLLVRSEIFKQVGPFDEAMLNTKENLDFCMTVMQAGSSIYFEPASVVTYVFDSPLTWTDVPFYMLRWNDAWTLASLHRLRDKWNLTEDRFFANRYKNLGWRRKMAILRPLSRRVPSQRISRRLERTLVRIDKVLNRNLTTHYTRKQAQLVSS